MFDWVDYEAKCWRCGEELTKFQSKDGDCLLNVLLPKQVTRFYDSCPKCRAWNEYRVISKEVEIVLDEPESRGMSGKWEEAI